MDTSSYLRSQGWLGTGHALNSHKPGLGLEAGQRAPGLAKPLTIPQKQNVFGVGKKQHDSHADQWWARAFDDVLKGVNNNNNNAGGASEGQKTEGGVAEAEREQQPPRMNMISMRMGGLGKHGNLYGNFVRGEGLRGTLLKAEEEGKKKKKEEEVMVVVVGERGGVANGQVVKGMKRRREDGLDEDGPAGKKTCNEELVTSENLVAGHLPAPKMAVQESSISLTSESAAGSSRDQRRRQRQQQEARKAKELADVQHALKLTMKGPIKVNGELQETKEERRQRRKEKGESKAAEGADTQMAFIAIGEEPVCLIQEGTETKAQRKQRREERRATKAAIRAKPQIALKSLAEERVSRNNRGSETKEERRQRREERRARKATGKPKVTVHEAVMGAIPMQELENVKARKVVPDGRANRKSSMTGDPSTVALKREKRARDERKKKKKREQKSLV